METSVINYYAVLVGAVASMVIGAIWYGPLFGKKWLEIIGISNASEAEKQQMQKAMIPAYAAQFVLTLFQVLILAHLVADTTQATGLERALWIWAAFVIPTLAGAIMWTNESSHNKLSRFLIQGGYQLVMFVVFGLLLQFWV